MKLYISNYEKTFITGVKIMAYDICRICSKFFSRNGNTTCDDCTKKDKEEYDKVREFVMSHRGATVLDVINSTGISFKTIMRYVEEGTLSYTDDKIEID